MCLVEMYPSSPWGRDQSSGTTRNVHAHLLPHMGHWCIYIHCIARVQYIYSGLHSLALKFSSSKCD